MARQIEDLTRNQKLILTEWAHMMGMTEQTLVEGWNLMEERAEKMWAHLDALAAELPSVRWVESLPKSHNAHQSRSHT